MEIESNMIFSSNEVLRKLNLWSQTAMTTKENPIKNMKDVKKRTKIVFVICDCITFLLLILNIVYLTIEYMKYGTDTNVAPHIPVKLNITKLSLCFKIDALLNSKTYEYSFFSSSLEYSNLTFQEVFNRVPPASQVIDSCKYRDMDLNVLVDEKDGKKCTQMFQISRFRMQGYMCYRFEWNNSPVYSYHAVVNSLYEPRELFHLTIRNPLADQHVVYPLFHFDDLPDDVRSFNKEVYKEGDSTFQLSYGFYESYRLPSPYETHCKDLSKISCFQKCIDAACRTHGFSSDSGLVMENSSDAFLNPLAIRSQKKYDLDQYRRLCYDSCQYEACIQFTVNTHIRIAKNQNDKLLLIIQTVDRLIIKIQYLSKFAMVDLFTQIGSVIAIWTGISVITIAKLFECRKKISKDRLYFRIKSYWFIVRLAVALWSKRNSTHKLMTEMNNEKFDFSEKSSKVSILRNLLKFTILGVFVWQLFEVFDRYFVYLTTTKFLYDMNPQVHIPSLSLCISFQDISGHHRIITEENYD